MTIEIHIEGDKRLYQGFNELFRQTGKRNIQVRMGGSITETAKKFLNPHTNGKLLLADMDGEAELRPKQLKYMKVEKHGKQVYFMVQNMEAWFLSQPEVIKAEFGLDVSKSIKRPAHEISEPDKFLNDLLRGKGEYHKIKHGLSMLKNLKLNELKNKFPDVKNLVTELSKA